MRTSLLFSPKATLTFFSIESGEIFSLVITGNRWNYWPAQLLALLKTWLWAKKFEDHCLRSRKKASCLRRFIVMIQDSLSITQIFIERLLWQLYASEAWSMAVAKQNLVH